MRYFDTVHPAAAAFCFCRYCSFPSFRRARRFSFRALGGIAFCAVLNRGRRTCRDTVFDILLFLLVAVTNPLFVHSGATPLFFLNGNAVTAEAVLCGIGLAVTLLSAVVWFRCFNIIMTSDKLLFLFGRLSPKIALLLSSALRFVPLFGEQARKIRAAQRTMGLYASDSLTDRLCSALRVYSALITWALENAVDTGSSMKGARLRLERAHLVFAFPIRETRSRADSRRRCGGCRRDRGERVRQA